MVPPQPAAHLPGGGLGREEGALEVGVEDPVPERLLDLERGADLLDAGIVDQDVEPAQRVGGRGHAGAHWRRPTGRRSRPAPRARPAAAIAAAQPRSRGRVARGDRDVGAEAGEAHGQRLADAAAGAGDQRLAAGEARSRARRRRASARSPRVGRACRAGRRLGQSRARLRERRKGVRAFGAAIAPSRWCGSTGVSRRFGDNRAVDDVSLALAQGAFLTILGPSGCGKTTLLRMIAGFIAPTAGEIVIHGQPVAALPPWRRRIGMVFQKLALFPHLTAFENVAYPVADARLRRAPRSRRGSSATWSWSGSPASARRRPHELSGGQQQRVAIARALVFEPDLLLLDEPLAALDRKLREEMQLEFRRIQRELGVTTINVTHDQREALIMSDRVLVMDRGRVQQLGAAAGDLRAARQPLRRGLPRRSPISCAARLVAGDGGRVARRRDGAADVPRSDLRPGPGGRASPSAPSASPSQRRRDAAGSTARGRWRWCSRATAFVYEVRRAGARRVRSCACSTSIRRAMRGIVPASAVDHRLVGARPVRVCRVRRGQRREPMTHQTSPSSPAACSWRPRPLAPALVAAPLARGGAPPWRRTSRPS